MTGRIGFEVSLGNARDDRGGPPRRSNSMRILVLADLSGRGNRGLESAADLASRPIMALDLDTFDTVFRRMAPRLELAPGIGGAASVAVGFDSLDDFHPDRLYTRVEPFRALRESRARLLDPLTFEQESLRLMESAPHPVGATAATPATEAARTEDPAELLQRLIGAPAEPAARPAATQSVVDGLIRSLVQPHITPGSTRSAAPFIDALDRSLTELMRAVLHDARFQRLEATWRGIRRLVDTLDLGDELTLFLVDVSKAELLSDLDASRGDPSKSAAHRLVVDANRRGADEQPWSLLVGHYGFDANADDIALLGHLGVIASRAGGPLLAAAQPGLLGCERLGEDAEPHRWAFVDADVEKLWTELKSSPIAAWLGLALPRILLRQPYGAKSDPIEGFAFEELGGVVRHEDYLWGNPALACAGAIARAFLDEGPGFSIEGPFEIDDLPAHVRDQDGERRLQPCAEFALPVRVGEEIVQRGMIPLLSYGNRNAVRVVGVRSIAGPLATGLSR
jgi:type VI secretion system protein ImpC